VVNAAFSPCGSPGKAGPNGAFGNGIIAFRPAEIDQYAVTDVAGDEAVELADGGGKYPLAGAERDLTDRCENCEYGPSLYAKGQVINSYRSAVSVCWLRHAG
jgi:hypothetical protein